ncbi:PorT family protein [Mucilaginibacter sp. HMF5004]|uniref:porin family protein n=1 Tax=Mucilaginibacter rivuli TaxID=2857527 RepID=UPI001C5CE17C|nr:porin family protein [Mucilaginibacter rivuli]MBW4891546.1 PorT family protein [Mucilaginibacter rivuli]
MIKRALPLVLLALLPVVNAIAQKQIIKKIHLSVKGGVNLSSFTNDVAPFDPYSKLTSSSRFFENYTKYFRVSIIAGVTADYPISKSFSIATELLYNARGAAYRVGYGTFSSGSSSSVEGEYNYYRYKIDYIALPLLVQYNLMGPKSRFSYLVYGGIAPALAIKTGVTQLYHNKDGSVGSADYNLDNVRKLNLSPVAGLQFGGNRQKRMRPFCDLRFEYTALPVFDKESIFNGYNLSTRMWTGSISAGIRF